MLKLTSEADKVRAAKAHEAGQGHIFDGWEDLAPPAQRNLLAQVGMIDFQLVNRLIEEHIRGRDAGLDCRVLKPASAGRLPAPSTDREEYELCRTLGEYALKKREVMLVMAAGGGSFGPNSGLVGLLPLGPVTRKSLFQLHAEKVQALNRRYRTSIKWTIFCHPEERDPVAAFFKSKGHFGLPPSDLCIAAQDLLPVVDRRGKIILAEPGRIAMSPNGHGGIVLRLLEEGRLEAMESAGVRHLFYFQVDNPLVDMADPVFLGWHIKNQCDVSSKTVRKKTSTERVGVFCDLNGALQVIEHTEISREDAERRLPDGSLELGAANIGTHAFSLGFLSRLRGRNFQLPFHPVGVATPCVSKNGCRASPARPNGVKFVTFAFDAISHAERASLLEVERENEFSPIKQPEGNEDSVESARRDLSTLYARWIEEAAPGALAGAGEKQPVEISPLYALDAKELKQKLELPLPAGPGGILLGGTVE